MSRELIETTRRLTLTAVLSIVAQGTSEQAVFSVFMSILFVKLYAYFAPYIADSDDILAEVGQYQILFTFFGALIMQGSLVDPEYYGMVGGFLVCINIGVVIVPLYYAVEEYLTEKESIEQQNCEEEYKAKVSSHNPSEDPTNGENTVSNILLQSPLSDKSSSHAFETEVDSGDVELAIIQPRLSGNFHSKTLLIFLELIVCR